MIEYNGTPFCDEKYSGGPQKIPGKVMCAYYDFGGMGVAYYDVDNINHGSGELNEVDGSYLHSFRIDEGVSTSYVKFFDEIDNNPYNLFEPEENMLYIGWTKPGNLVNYTVDVMQSGTYLISLLYTSRFGGKISISVDLVDVTGPIDITSTYVKEDPVDWRQWHHWNLKEISAIELSQGTHLITLTTVEEGNMNYGYLDFVKIE